MHKIDIPCIILCGGKSSRMGVDKALLPFDEYDTMVEYQYNKLSKIFKDIYLSSKTDKFNFSAPIIYDNNQNISSPMIALESIFEKLNDKKVFIISVDVPFVHTSTISKLIIESNNTDITIAKDRKKTHYLCGVFNKEILINIKELIQNDIHKINYLVKNTFNHRILEFSDENQFINLNSKQDYKKALNISKYYRIY